MTHDNSIYRTQRETFDIRQILPGISVRRVRMPLTWAGQTLIDLDFRRQFDLNVIGLLDHRGMMGVRTFAWARPLPRCWKKGMCWWCWGWMRS
ncbi:MAG: hypothetical protein M5U34_23590 [Chloroflexi bacterium]|nr:hypothetical protein [Chloroflexota bacterium]